MNDKYEYRIERLKEDEYSVNQLNGFGIDRWELVSVMYYEQNFTFSYVYYFKRKIQNNG